jgi:hypothetical protein
MLHLLRWHQYGQRLSWDIWLTAAAHAQHSLEFVWEYLDKAGQYVRPVVQYPPGATAAGQFHVPSN